MSEAGCSSNNMGQSSVQYNYQSNSNSSSMGSCCQHSSGNSAAAELFTKYGVQGVQQAVNNAAADFLRSELGKMITDSCMSAFMKDDALAKLESILDGYTCDVAPGAQSGVDNTIAGGSSGSGAGSSGSTGNAANNNEVMAATMDMIRQAMQEETSSASSGSSNQSGKGNWLALLARALGKVAGEHLKKMVELGEKMGSIDSKEDPEMFAQIQAEFQAEAQIFKMFQEAIGTMIKSIGEGMSSVARKQ